MVSLRLFSSVPSPRSLRFWWPWLGLFMGLALTISAWSQVNRAEQARFDEFKLGQLTSMVERVERRMNTLKVVLQGAASYLGRGALPSRTEWRTYVENLDLNSDYPGIQGLGFAEWIPKADLEAHLRRVRGEGFPDYQVVPGGPLVPDPEGCSAIVYLEPMDVRNLRAIGKDMLAEPVRRDALLRARDTGLPALSGKVVLYQEGDVADQPGTLLFVPVYRQGWPLETVAQRRAALRGWAYHPFRMGDLLRGTLSGDTKRADFELFDGLKTDAEHLLFDSDPLRAAASHDGELVRSFDVAGRTWTAQVQPSAFFFGSAGRNEHLNLLAWGLAASLLLFLLLVAVLGAEDRARQLADQRGNDLLATESRFRALFEKAPYGMAIVDSGTGRFLSVNPHLGEILGYSSTELLERGFQAITHPEFREADQAAMRDLMAGTIVQIRKEKRYLHKDGHDIWGRVSVVRLPTEPGTGARHLAILEDITEVRQRAEELRDSQARFQEIFDLSPDPITLSRQSDGALLMANPAWCELTGIPMEEALGQSTAALGLWSDPVSRAALMAELNQVGHIAARPSLILRRDGSKRHVLITGRTLNHRGEDLVLILGKDVTALHETEVSLRAALAEARQFREALDRVPTHVYIKDLDSRYLYACRKTLDLFGVSAGELVGCDDSRFFPPDVVARLRAIDARVFQGEETQEEIVMTNDKGERQVFWEVKTPIYSDLERTHISGLLGISMDITEQKSIEAALRRSEADLAKAQVIGQFGSWKVEYSEGGERWSCSEGLRRIYGFPPEQPITYQTGFESMHPEDRAQAAAAWQAAAEGRGPCEWEHRILRAGAVRWLAVRVEFMRSAAGRLMEASGTVQDITERKTVERALQDGEARLRQLGDQLPDSYIYRYQARPGEVSRFIYLSAGVERLCGLKAEDVLRDPGLLFNQIDPDLLPAYYEAEATSARDLSPFAMDLRQCCPDGQWRWFRVRSTPRPQPDGSVIWEGISTDVTERHTHQVLLEESEARFRILAETAPVLIWMTDAAGRCVHFNQAWTDWTGLPLEQALGEGWLEVIHAEERTPCQERFARALGDREPFAMEFRLRHRSGAYRWISDRGTPRFAADGTFLGYIGAGIDIQDMKEAEAAIRESELRVHKAESMVLMAGGIAHDFNNLFQSILGYLEIATLKADEDTGVVPILKKAVVSLQKAIGLSWKMLDFSGRSFIRAERMDLEGWLPAYLATLSLELPTACHLDLSCSQVPGILGDSAKLEEVIKALVDNAREAAGPEGARISVRLYTDFGEDRIGAGAMGIWRLPRPEYPATVCLEVADNGPGVSPEQLKLICDPFYTTKELGRGLGLAATVGILTAHQAGLHLLNGQDGGLILRMHFPPN